MRREGIIRENLNFLETLLCIVNSVLNRSKSDGNTLASFPFSIGEYKLIHPILEHKEPRFYRLGLYENPAGEQAIAKQWRGKRKNMNYYWLINEINAYQEIQYLYEKNKMLQKRYPHVRFPKLLAVKKKPDQLVMLLERAEGELLETLEVPARMPVYEEIILFFRELGNHLDASTARIFRKRSAWTIGILFFMHLIRAVIKHPQWLPSLGRATLLFVIRFPELVKDKEVSLVHRDLVPWNIILKDKEIWVIDFQLLTITHRMYELVALNSRQWEDPAHWRFFQSTKTMKKVFSNPHSFAVYQALALYISIFNLANHYSIPHEVAYDYLKYWLKSPAGISNK